MRLSFGMRLLRIGEFPVVAEGDPRLKGLLTWRREVKRYIEMV